MMRTISTIVLLVFVLGFVQSFAMELTVVPNREQQVVECQEYIGTIAWQHSKPAVSPLTIFGLFIAADPDESSARLRITRPPVFSSDAIPLSSLLVYTQTTSSDL